MVMTSCLVLLALALCCLHGDAHHLTDLDVSISEAEDRLFRAQGFTLIPVDLNRGAGGRYVYLWFKTGDSPAITRLQLTFNDDMSKGLIDLGFTKINKDLNAGTGGDEIYLWFLRGHGEYHTPIEEVSVTAHPSDEPPKEAAGWEGLACDLNRGAVGPFIRLWVKRTQQTYISNVTATIGFGVDGAHFRLGYIRLDEDTNRGAAGPATFIWFRQTTDPRRALKALLVGNNVNSHIYRTIDVNLNEGSADSLYLWFRIIESPPITAILLIVGEDARSAYIDAGAYVNERNLNTGNEGTPLYLVNSWQRFKNPSP